MKIIITLFCLLCITISNEAQTSASFPSFKLADIPGGAINREASFNGDALWGHINGGADIYLEYGFDKLLFQEVAWKGFEFRVEFYRMNSAESAFGIFSLSKYKCLSSDTLTKWMCITPFQVQGAVASYYISIANDKGTQEAQSVSTELFKIVLNKISESNYSFPSMFIKPSLKLYLPMAKLIKGKLGIQNGFPEWSDMFDEFNNFKVFIIDQNEAEPNFVFSLIEFSNSSDMQKFIKLNNLTQRDDSKIFYAAKDQTTIRVKDVGGNKILLVSHKSNLIDKNLILVNSLLE